MHMFSQFMGSYLPENKKMQSERGDACREVS